MTQQFENFVNAALDKSLASDVTLPTADKIPVFTGIGRQVTGKTKAELGLATSSQLTDKADLVEGKVPSSQLPSYVDDVLEYPNLASFPLLGEASKLYIAIDTNLVYRWSGSTYAVTSSSLALGETLSTAYRGDRGKTAYNHSQVVTGNPHGTTKSDIGLGNVDNTSDAGKPISTATQTALNNKQAALADVITANTYGSSTQYPVITFNAKGLATGVTLQTVPTPTFTDANFSVQKNGSPSITASWDLTALTSSAVHTYPNKAIDFGTMSSVATTDFNTLSGTRTRILGGSHTTVSGTDNVAINCDATILGDSATEVTAISCFGVGVTRETTKAFLAGCSNIVLNPDAPHNNGLVALGVAYKKDAFSEFPQWTGHTIIGTEDGIHACITVYGSNYAAGNVNLTSSTGVKPLAAIGSLSYTKGVQHIIHLIGQNTDSPNKVVTVAYKVIAFGISGGIALGAVQTIEPLFNAVGTPATPTVTISITAFDRLNINVASADAMYWAARVDSYFA